MSELGKNRSSMLETAAALLLIGMFAVLSAVVMALGISAYNKTNKISADNYAQRTVLSYIANQVRRGDVAGGVEIRDADGIEMLVFRQDFDGTEYLTCLYAYDGALRELFTEDGFAQELASGVPIMPAAALSFEARGGLIDVEVTEESGETRNLTLAPRSGVKAPGG